MYIRNPEVPFQTIEEQVIILNSKLGQAYQLNETASFVWNLLAIPYCVEDIVKQVELAYELEGNINNDINDLISHFLKYDLVSRK